LNIQKLIYNKKNTDTKTKKSRTTIIYKSCCINFPSQFRLKKKSISTLILKNKIKIKQNNTETTRRRIGAALGLLPVKESERRRKSDQR
jgi:hypothetical protein